MHHNISPYRRHYRQHLISCRHYNSMLFLQLCVWFLITQGSGLFCWGFFLSQSCCGQSFVKFWINQHCVCCEHLFFLFFCALMKHNWNPKPPSHPISKLWHGIPCQQTPNEFIHLMSVLCSSKHFPFHTTDKQTTVSGFVIINSRALKSGK